PPPMDDANTPPPAPTAAMPTQPSGDPFAAPAPGSAPLFPPTVPLASDGPPNESFLTRKVAKLPVIGWIALAAVAIVAVIGAVVLGGDDDDGDDTLAINIAIPTTTIAPAITTTTTTTLPPATTVEATPETTTATTEVPETTVPASGDGATPDTAILLGDPATAQFTYDSPYADVSWSGSVVAISEGTAYEPTDGICLIVYATLIPTAVEGFVSYGYDSPPMNLIIDGEEQEEAYGACEYEEIEAAGWTGVFEASGTIGTEFPVYTEFQVPESTDLNDLLLVVGAADATRTYFRGPVSPAPQAELKPGAPLGVATAPMADGTAYVYENPFDSSSWSVTLDGLVDQQVDSFTDDRGVCYGVVGVATPVTITGLLSSGYDAPEIGIVADGRYFGGAFSQCEDANGVLAGRDDLYEAAVTAGTQYPYYSQIFVPERFAGSIEAVLVGDAGFGGTAYAFAPTVVSPPPVTPVPGNPVGGEQLPVGTVVNLGDDGLGSAWDVVVRGLIESPPTPEGRCLAIIGIATPTISDEPTAPGYTIPTMSIVVDGREVSETFGLCDLSAIEAAGYGDYFNADVAVGTPYAFYVSTLVPAANTAAPEVVLVGDGTFAVPPLVVATILPEIPPL
ncbi:MAG TPA: hypothetical protein VMM60_04580, partial [Ilumatobacter sp.]|nr:hypothetical protein [Ilumatobacter sp.]